MGIGVQRQRRSSQQGRDSLAHRSSGWDKSTRAVLYHPRRARLHLSGLDGLGHDSENTLEIVSGGLWCVGAVSNAHWLTGKDKKLPTFVL